MNTKRNLSQGKGAPVALITAGGRGMGAAVAREMHARGYRIAVMSPSGSAEELAAELGGVGARGSTKNEVDLARLVQITLDAYGRIDAVLNHTGGPPKGDLLDIAESDWMIGHELIMLSVIRMAKLVTPHMLQQGKGVFLNITTFAALEPTLAFPVSCAYRAAVSAFTKLYADRYASANIRMNALLPGYIDSLEHKPGTEAAIPMGRIGTVQEIAKTSAFLLSDDASYITGQSIRIDGGVTRHV
jgi:NAD(P)-dependent dehydrogenase (short-subunit alcohol dehydrogenase family)